MTPTDAHPSDNPVALPEGMTLQQWYAGLAMNGILSGYDMVKPDSWLPKPEIVAEYAVKIAETLCKLQER
ncbi:MAG: hypothetical protein HJJLKODD_00882 [Phycisphaerae bacterium]|nr:hypothetical protein [Phycisphaerae bacterium]